MSRDSLDIAIVGMACIFPGAPDLAAYWRNLRAGADAIREVPAARWDPVFYDPAARSVDRFYCKRGGFIDAYANFDAVGYGVMPVAARGAEPDQLLTLDVATRALLDAGYDDRATRLPRDRTGVILGRGGYAGAGRTRLEQHVRTAEQLVTALRGLLPDLGEAELARVKAEFQSQLGAVGSDSAIGLVPNLAASRLAHRLDLHGPAFTVDAACASALVAVDQACRELETERSDVMLVGGVHVCHDEAFWSVFCQLGALSRSQQIRPFDRKADGLLIGEGIGVVVLKRRADAERDGDRVYAVLRGTGVASDGREASLMTPRVEGQLLALERAWTASGLDPETIGLLEAHGTGTPAGDAAELTTLARFFGGARRGERDAVLGSVKSMIGHAMPAAGAAGLIKAALAVHHGVRLPTLHCDEPSALLDATRFRVIPREETWDAGTDPRRAAVNAFGFGGINAHVVLESHVAPSYARTRSMAPPEREGAAEKVALFAAASIPDLVAALDAGREEAHPQGAVRLAVLDPTPERLARARTVAEKGRPWRGREGIWFSPKGLLGDGGKVAFLFPGVDASFEPHVDDVAAHFGLPVPPCTTARNLEEAGLGIVGVNRLLDRVLREVGVKPAMLAGHSIGEWSGMVSSGIIPDEALDAFIATLKPGTLEVPGVVFAAAGCGVEAATLAMEGLDAIALSHDNCPHQVIFCGREDSIDEALARLRAEGVLCQKLSFQSGFHSPLFEDYVDPHRANFARLPLEAPKAELWSATTCAPYPHEPDAIRALAIDHLVKPVRFRELVEALYAKGARVFVQVGTGSLVNFVEDTLRGRPHVAISANVKDRAGLAQLRRVLAALFVEGAEVDFGRVAARAPSRAPMPLALGVPLVRMTTPIARGSSLKAPPAAEPTTPIGRIFADTMRAVAEAQTEVLTKLAQGPAARPAPRPVPAIGPREVTTTHTLSIEAYPDLMDHSFFRQAPGWTNVSDRHPVVPMTMSIGLIVDHAQAMAKGRVVVGVEDVRAYRWLAVSTPVDAKITCRHDGKDRVHVAIADYCEGTAILADRYPDAPPADVAPLDGGVPSTIDAKTLYADRWMFHGPRYQGVTDVGVVGTSGIRGELVTGAAKGALLDNAGQLFGFWVMVKNETNRMAMPVRIGKLHLYGPHPAAGERLTCTVHIREHGERAVLADLELAKEGRAWARIEAWEDRRFDTDARLWPVMLWPEKNLLAVPQPEGFALFEDIYRSAPTRDQLARRFLTEAERSDYAAQGPRKQRTWLTGRIAGKDAVRDLLWKRGHGALFPAEITIANETNGKPVVRAPGGVDVRLSLAHKDDIAVAIAACGRDVGIDVERIEPRGEGFADIAFTDDERRMLAAAAGAERDEATTRFWCAKEAVAKARGTGLEGNPRRFPVLDRAGDRLLVAGTWVTTKRHGDFIIGWTDV